MSLPTQIDDIKKYTQRYESLSKSHHFQYDFYNPKLITPDENCLVLMGINPGENGNEGDFTHETSLSNFVEKPLTPWRTCRNEILGNTENIIQTQLFFWSSKDSKQSFKSRFGSWRDNEHHLLFCKNKNIELFDRYNPRAIIFPGLSAIKRACKLYDLEQVEPPYRDKGEKNHRLVEHYRDKRNRPWIFTKHWTGWHGLLKSQKTQIAERIGAILKYA